VALTPDGRTAVFASKDQTMQVWDLEREVFMANFTVDGNIYACAVAPDGRTIVAGDDFGKVYFLRLEGV